MRFTFTAPGQQVRAYIRFWGCKDFVMKWFVLISYFEIHVILIYLRRHV